MAGRTLIDGVYKTIKGGNALVDGVSKKIKCGKVLVEGVVRKITLAYVLEIISSETDIPMGLAFVQREDGSANYAGATIVANAGETVTVVVGTYTTGAGWSDKMYVKLNGTIVAQGGKFSKGLTYQYTPNSDATIKFICVARDVGGKKTFAAEIVES